MHRLVGFLLSHSVVIRFGSTRALIGMWRNGDELQAAVRVKLTFARSSFSHQLRLSPSHTPCPKRLQIRRETWIEKEQELL